MGHPQTRMDALATDRGADRRAPTYEMIGQILLGVEPDGSCCEDGPGSRYLPCAAPTDVMPRHPC
jgi:hypothetical protein